MLADLERIVGEARETGELIDSMTDMLQVPGPMLSSAFILTDGEFNPMKGSLVDAIRQAMHSFGMPPTGRGLFEHGHLWQWENLIRAMQILAAVLSLLITIVVLLPDGLFGGRIDRFAEAYGVYFVILFFALFATINMGRP
jgi:hypothetical protein